jgi:hypothetical protein
MSQDDDVRPVHLSNPEDDDRLGDHSFDQMDDEDVTDSSSLASYELEEQILNTGGISFEEESSDEEPESFTVESDNYDPTLPQFRPDVDDSACYASPRSTAASDLPDRLRLEPNGTTSLPAPPSPQASPQAEAVAPKLPPSPMQPLPPPSKSIQHAAAQENITPRRPSNRTLIRWAYLNQVERDAKERGGSGARLDFDEFSRRMAADKGRRLAFVASWIEMASF